MAAEKRSRTYGTASIAGCQCDAQQVYRDPTESWRLKWQ